MGMFAEQIENLTNDLKSSRQSRAQHLAGLKAQTKGLLNQFRVDDQARAEEIRSHAKQTRNLLKQFHKERKAMAGELKEGLSVFVSELRSDVHNLLGKFKLMCEERAEALKTDLAAVRAVMADLAADFRQAHQIWMGRKTAPTAKPGVKSEKEPKPKKDRGI